MEKIILDKDCYPKLFRILRSKYPLLGKNEVAELIDKTRENNGVTLSSLKKHIDRETKHRKSKIKRRANMQSVLQMV